MKKVLAIVLSLSMVLGSFGFAFAAEDTTSKKTASNKSTNFSDVVGTDCEDAVKVLTDLGVVTGYDDGLYKPENVVTRAEMAVLVVNALGLKSYVTEGAKSTFTDMANYGWAEGYISYAQSLGVISGYGDGTFQPGKTVSYDEVATMLVAALGYTPESLQGTWPANYVTQAKAKGILDGITAGPNGANRGDVATMIYQTLDQAIGKVNKDGDWKSIGITFNAAGNATEWDNMLNRLGAKLYVPDYPLGDKGEEFIVTRDIADNDSMINLYPYIGARVKAYMNSDDDIIAVKEVVSTFLTGEYDGYDTITVGDVDYDVKVNKAAATEAAMYLVNTDNAGTAYVSEGGVSAQPTKTFDQNGNTAVENTGKETYTFAVDVSGKTIKQIYSISYWDATDADYFSSSDAADIKDDKSLFGVDFPTDNNGDVDANAFDLIGVSSLNDIKTDNVVYVYENKDNEIARVAVGTEVVTGEVSRVNSDNEPTISGKLYKIAKNQYASVPTFKAGDTMTLYLDAYGNIYDTKKGAGEPDDYAIVLDYTKNAGTGLGDTTPQIKLFLPDGTSKTFDIDTDAIDEGDIAGATTPTATTISMGGIEFGAIVGYNVNKSGEIDEITTYGGVSGDASSTGVQGKKINEKGYFSSHQIDKNAVIFTWDGATGVYTKADDYGTASYDSVLDSDTIANVTYVVDDNKIVAMRLDGFSSSNDVYGLVKSKVEKVSGDYKYEVTMLLSDGQEKTYKTDFALAPETSQAVYKLSFDGSGALKDLNDKISAGVKETTYAALDVSTSAINKNGNTLVGGFLVDPSHYTGVTNTSITLDSNFVIYKYNTNNGKYEKGTISDIVRTTSAALNIELFDVDGDDGVYDIITYTK